MIKNIEQYLTLIILATIVADMAWNREQERVLEFG